MSKEFLQKLRMAASESDDLLTSCDASDLLDGLEVARDFMFEAAAVIEELESRLAQVERERDALKCDLCTSCPTCKHWAKHSCTIGRAIPYECELCDEYEWRGVYEENTKEEADEP